MIWEFGTKTALTEGRIFKLKLWGVGIIVGPSMISISQSLMSLPQKVKYQVSLCQTVDTVLHLPITFETSKTIKPSSSMQ